MRSLLRRILDSAGFEVVEGADGQQGLDVLSRGPLPDVALVDWNIRASTGSRSSRPYGTSRSTGR